MMMPATCLASSRLNEGANCASVTLDGTLPTAVVTTTGTVPKVVSFGACRLIWVGADKHLVETRCMYEPTDLGETR